MLLAATHPEPITGVPIGVFDATTLFDGGVQ